MKVLLVHNYFLADDAVEQKVMRPYPPLGILSISAYLESKEVDHQIFDGTFSTQDKLNELLIEESPEYIGFYVNFLLREKVLNTVEFIKEQLPKTTIILGGPDVKYYADNYLNNAADYIVIGEGELSFFELIDALSKGKETSKIAGIGFKQNENIQINPPRDHIANLDLLPFPNRKKINYKNYISLWKKHHKYSSVTINTQRGCPYSCNWCSHAVYGESYRRRSPKNVVKELKVIVEQYYPDRFWFVDDVFNMSKKWLKGFNQELKNENLSIAYECITRADKLDKETIHLLKDSGCSFIWIGAESGSQKVLDLMNRRVEAKQVREMIKLAKAFEIETGTFIMLGYPGENEADILETIAHLKDSDPDIFTINKAYPIKGTKLYDVVKHLIDKKTKWKSTPDYEVDFKRTYRSQYYYFAYRKIYNEVWRHKHKNRREFNKYLKASLKSMIANLGMKLMKI